MAVTSVKVPQLRPDPDLLPQDAREHPARRCALEAGEAATRVGAPARLGAAGDEHALARREAEQVALRRPPAATDACSLRG
jgi:hypothetical protein